MSLILPAFSSPDLKVVLRLKKPFKSSAGGQGETVSSVSAFFQLSLRSSLQEAATPATDSPGTRFSLMAAVVLSGCLCQSRKDPYLPLEPQCVRLLPRPTGLPPMAFAVSFRIRFADAKTAVKHHRPKRADGRFRVGAELTVVPRPKDVTLGMYAMCSIFLLSPPDVLPVL